jgi:hypothetical protein
MATIVLINERLNQTKLCPTGISWSYFWLGVIVPIYRNDWKFAAIVFLLGMVTLGLSHFYFMFKYNEHYIKSLLADGFVPKSEEDANILKSLNY